MEIYTSPGSQLSYSDKHLPRTTAIVSSLTLGKSRAVERMIRSGGARHVT